MNTVETIKKAFQMFRRTTAPLDWLEFAAFLLAAAAGAGILIWAFLKAAVTGAREGDWLGVLIAVLPLLLLGWGLGAAVVTGKLNWILIAFLALASAIAFYFLYV